MKVLSWVFSLIPKWKPIIKDVRSLANWIDQDIDQFPELDDLKEKWQSGGTRQKARAAITFVNRLGEWLENSFENFPENRGKNGN